MLHHLPLLVQKRLLKDFVIISLSILIAVLFARYNILTLVTQKISVFHQLSSFVAGLFFTSVFTTAPAIVVLGEIANSSNSIIGTAFFGAFGSLLGDLFIFRFVRDNVTQDFHFIFDEIKKEKNWLAKHHKFFELHAFRWIIPLLGALIIASPLPDELGIAILGLSKVKTATMIPLTYSLNFLGIVLIGTVAKNFF